MKKSEIISSFLNSLTDIKTEYNINYDNVGELDKLTQDYLHSLELENHSYHASARLSKDLTECRKQRRKSKDLVLIDEVIVRYCESEDGKRFVNQLSNLLGEVRKVENKLENRIYIPKSVK